MHIDPIVGWDQYQECEILGAFYSAPKIWEISVRNQIRFSTTGLFGTTFEGGPLWPVHSFWSVRPKCPFLFDKLLFPVLLFCILLTRTIPRCAVAWVLVSVSGTYHFIGQVEFPKFQTGKFLLNRKHSLWLILHRAVVIATIPACNNFTVRVNTELLTA